MSRVARLLRGSSRATVAAVASVLAVGSAIIACIGFGIATANDSERAGPPIADATAQALSLAALSCRDLTGPRLAGLMAAGAMTPAEFEQWAPWPGANANDSQARSYALAHGLCDLVGQVRSSQIAADVWDAALAAYRTGIDTVKRSKGVPAAAQSYVDTVNRYANWYARQPVFRGDAAGTSASRGASPRPWRPVRVPDADLPAVLAAGRRCPEVTPVHVAAQLMASSGFDPNKRSPLGQLGIAQFSPDLWQQYAKPSDSPWDPPTAIATLGAAMCDLVGQLGKVGGDPYQLALAGFRVGPTPVRQAPGALAAVPGLQRFVEDVNVAVRYYSQDPRLTAAATATPARTPGRPAHTSTPSGN
nr:hypothetical protein GCM10020063_040830 [Dactylosporangium thailandense]